MNVSTKLSESDKAFQKQLAFGQMAETTIAKWLISKGRLVLPIYDIEYDTGKGPRLFGHDYQEAAPDLLVWGSKGVVWCEAKHKTVFAWYRIKQHWTTGIDSNHWEAYKSIAVSTNWPVWLLFLHRQSTPSNNDIGHGCPKQCPTGLFGEELSVLEKNVSNRTKKYGRHGMIYWAHEALQELDSLENVERAELKK